jgi:hypothetical protein
MMVKKDRISRAIFHIKRWAFEFLSSRALYHFSAINKLDSRGKSARAFDEREARPPFNLMAYN